jgi:predicted O-methyltransferase YrrM
LNIERALAIEGFMAPIELEYLAFVAQSSQAIVEVGSWCGRSTRAFADNTPGRVWAVDTWADNAYGSAPAEMTRHPNWLFNEFSKNHADTIGDKVVRVRASSVEGARILAAEGRTFDLCFVDAGHHYEDVVSDIKAWLPLVRNGGVICGHDYATYHPGVIKAVDEWVPTRTIVPDTTIWTAEVVYAF